MKGGVLRLGILRLANQRKHSDQVEISWEQYSFPISGGLDSLVDGLAGLERVYLKH